VAGEHLATADFQELLFESQATTSYGDLEAYIRSSEGNPAHPSGLGASGRCPWSVPTPGGAQLADLYAGAAHEALEPDPHGYIEHRYLLRLTRQFVRWPGRVVWRDGFAMFPHGRSCSTRGIRGYGDSDAPSDATVRPGDTPGYG
jgi:hypothetical protein